MPDLLQVGALELTFAILFTVLALSEVAHLRQQRRRLRQRSAESRLEADRLAELSVEHAALQRRYNRARALIDLMGEFNQVMEFQTVLDRLSQRLSEFFAGDDVLIWIGRTTDDFELAASVVHEMACPTGPDVARLIPVLEQRTVLLPPTWQQTEAPWMAAPVLDSRGAGLGVVVLTSHRRTAYTVEDADFLRAVLGHAAMAIQNAARFEVADRLARMDPLTGLGNRGDFDRVLREESSRALSGSRPLSLLLADVDHFKHINDSRGHLEGDRVLRQIAQLIAQVAGEQTRAFRIGGEEFAVLLARAKADALSVAANLRQRIEQEAFFPDGTGPTLSVGVASLPEDAPDAWTLVAVADRALYQAKAGGRNRVSAA